MRNTTQKIVMASMLAALACVATMIIKIPSPLKGYINLGDCVVLVCGWALSPMYGFLAAAIGSALADILSGYVVYAPATFIIKGLMALAACFIFKFLKSRLREITSWVISGITAEAIMVVGYLIFEGLLYGFAPALVNIPANTIQGVAGLIVGVLLIRIFEKSKIIAK